MINSNFKKFKEAIIAAPIEFNNSNDGFIWSCGYLFLDLTEKQHTQIYDICVKKGLKTGFTETKEGKKETVFLPNGIGLYKIDTK